MISEAAWIDAGGVCGGGGGGTMACDFDEANFYRPYLLPGTPVPADER